MAVYWQPTTTGAGGNAQFQPLHRKPASASAPVDSISVGDVALYAAGVAGFVLSWFFAILAVIE